MIDCHSREGGKLFCLIVDSRLRGKDKEYKIQNIENNRLSKLIN